MNLGLTVGDRTAAPHIFLAQWRCRSPWQLVSHAEIAMAARLRNHRPGRPNPRPSDDARIDGALQPKHRPGHISHAGEPAHQRFARLPSSEEIEIAKVCRQGVSHWRGGRDNARMPRAALGRGDYLRARTSFESAWSCLKIYAAVAAMAQVFVPVSGIAEE
jgi:hypothetical protein